MDDVHGRASRWFATVDLDGASGPALAVLAELVDRLDQLRPTLLDRAASTVTATRRGRLEIHLEHSSDEHAEVDVDVSDHDASIAWLTADILVTEAMGRDGRGWTSVAAEYVAAVLSGEFEVATTSRGRWTVATTITDSARPGRYFSADGTFVTSWLPGLGARRTRQQRLDYGVRRGRR